MALATQMLASGRGVTGSAFFTEGMTSATDPMFIGDRAYRHAENVIHRGGALSTRPGYREVHTLAPGTLQGLQYLRPISGVGTLAVAVSGSVYQTIFPFSTLAAIPSVSFFPYAPNVYFCVATRSAERAADGTVQAIEPKRTLIMQDGGYTRAAYWDGTSSGHSDPTVVSDDEGVVSAGIPLGGPMAWSGGRLWVANKNKLFAGDIDDPFSFTENEYLAEGGFFAFDDDILALAEIPSLETPVLLVFTATKTYKILSGIRTRSEWKSTKDFLATFLPEIGCVSHRAVVSLNGKLWWMSQRGLVNVNAAQQVNTSSAIDPQDVDMAISKANLWDKLGGVALGSHENFLLCSVPYAHRWNTHTWVRDQSVIPGAPGSWAGIWTGTRPVEWASGVCGGAEKIFHISKDVDGQNRLWEAFRPEPEDNATRVQAFVETKTHIDFSEKATGLDLKNFVFAELTFTNLLGTVDVSVYWAGNYGKYKKLADYQLVATKGSLSTVVTISPTDLLFPHRGQTRVLRTPEIRKDPLSECSALNVETKLGDWVDVGFSLLIKWTGQASLRSYRIFADPFQELETGSPAFVETGPRVLAGSICA